MKKIAYIISHIHKAIAFEWISAYIDSDKFSLFFILLNPADSALENYLKEKKVPSTRINFRGKKDIPSAFWKVRKILKKEKVEIVHCHLFDACVIGLSAAKSLGIPKRIFTRHHANLHHLYFPRAVYYDKFINWLATDIVAISQNVQQILIQQESVRPSKVHLIHHGFKLDDFENIDVERIDRLRKKYQIIEKSPVIGVIARQTHWKGIQFIIPAFEMVLKKYPTACLVLANATGDYKEEINRLLEKIPSQNYREIVFEEDLFALYQLFDIYVHTPIDAESEAFGQTYVEALAAGIPSVFTLSGVANEFIHSEENALVVPFQNAEAIFEAVLNILQDKDLSQKRIEQGKKAVKKLFDLSKMIQALETLYEN